VPLHAFLPAHRARAQRNLIRACSTAMRAAPTVAAPATARLLTFGPIPHSVTCLAAQSQAAPPWTYHHSTVRSSKQNSHHIQHQPVWILSQSQKFQRSTLTVTPLSLSLSLSLLLLLRETNLKISKGLDSSSSQPQQQQQQQQYSNSDKHLRFPNQALCV